MNSPLASPTPAATMPGPMSRKWLAGGAGRSRTSGRGRYLVGNAADGSVGAAALRSVVMGVAAFLTSLTSPGSGVLVVPSTGAGSPLNVFLRREQGQFVGPRERLPVTRHGDRERAGDGGGGQPVPDPAAEEAGREVAGDEGVASTHSVDGVHRHGGNLDQLPVDPGPRTVPPGFDPRLGPPQRGERGRQPLR